VDFSTTSLKPDGPDGIMVSDLVRSMDNDPSVTYLGHFVWDPAKNALLLKDMTRQYPVHRDITVTIFWVGEEPSEENAGISNGSSAWDELWLSHYGGVDDPKRRIGYLPTSFAPREIGSSWILNRCQMGLGRL